MYLVLIQNTKLQIKNQEPDLSTSSLIVFTLFYTKEPMRTPALNYEQVHVEIGKSLKIKFFHKKF